MAAEPWGQGGQMMPLPSKKGVSPPSAFPRFENFDLQLPHPPIVRSLPDLKHKVICHPGLEQNDMPPLNLSRGGPSPPQFYTSPPPPHMERFRRPWGSGTGTAI